MVWGSRPFRLDGLVGYGGAGRYPDTGGYPDIGRYPDTGIQMSARGIRIPADKCIVEEAKKALKLISSIDTSKIVVLFCSRTTSTPIERFVELYFRRQHLSRALLNSFLCRQQSRQGV